MGLLDKLYERSATGLQKSMDLYLQRNNALTSNLANIETPGYRAVDVNFGSELEKAFNGSVTNEPISKTNAKHLDIESSSRSHLVPDYSGPTRADGNNVDLDIQVGKMLFTNSEYSKATQILRKELSLIKYAIREARG